MAKYRGATFDGVERQSLQQVKGGSHYPVNDACVIKYWVYYLTQKSRLAVNCHRFAQKKKAEREEMKNEINKT